MESHKKALDLDPKSIKNWVIKGNILNNLERYEEALESYKKALDLAPKSVDAWVNRGKTLNNLERYEEALESYQKGLNLAPKSVDAWVYQGIALLDIQRYEEALAACDRAVEIDSKNHQALNIQALALSLLKNFEKAITAIDEAINLEPKEVLYRANRGIILARKLVDTPKPLLSVNKRLSKILRMRVAITVKPAATHYKVRLDRLAIIYRKRLILHLVEAEAKQNTTQILTVFRDDERFRALM